MSENKILPIIDLTSEQEVRLRAAVRILIEHLLEHKHFIEKRSLTNSTVAPAREDNSPSTHTDASMV